MATKQVIRARGSACPSASARFERIFTSLLALRINLVGQLLRLFTKSFYFLNPFSALLHNLVLLSCHAEFAYTKRSPSMGDRARFSHTSIQGGSSCLSI